MYTDVSARNAEHVGAGESVTAAALGQPQAQRWHRLSAAEHAAARRERQRAALRQRQARLRVPQVQRQPRKFRTLSTLAVYYLYLPHTVFFFFFTLYINA